MTFHHKPTVDTPLGRLVAGEISQAQYRALRLEQLQRERMELVVPEPTLTTRRLHVDDRPSPLRATAWILIAIAWIVGFVLLAVLVAHLARSAAPRTSPDPTAPQPGASAADVASGGAVVAQVQASASGPISSPAPHERDPSRSRFSDLAMSGSAGLPPAGRWSRPTPARTASGSSPASSPTSAGSASRRCAASRRAWAAAPDPGRSRPGRGSRCHRHPPPH